MVTLKAIILAAGYAMRLYPLTENQPKTLLPVAGKPMVEYILDNLARASVVNEVVVVSNARFYDQLCDWKRQYHYPVPIEILNDGTTSNDNRLGAIADLQLAVKEYDINEDILVVAGDNLFDFEVSNLVRFYHEVQADCICAGQLDDKKILRRFGVVELDEDNSVLSFEEKPEYPKTNLAVPAIYIYRSDSIPLIDQYLAEGNSPDAPGNFIPWLIKHKAVYAYRFTGSFYDVGTLESYEEVNRVYGGPGG